MVTAGRSGWPADGRLSLRGALRGYHGSSVHGLLAPLEPVTAQAAVDEAFAPWLDCDTPADLAAARKSWQIRGTERSERHEHT
jgi:hypothetical protein